MSERALNELRWGFVDDGERQQQSVSEVVLNRNKQQLRRAVDKQEVERERVLCAFAVLRNIMKINFAHSLFPSSFAFPRDLSRLYSFCVLWVAGAFNSHQQAKVWAAAHCSLSYTFCYIHSTGGRQLGAIALHLNCMTRQSSFNWQVLYLCNSANWLSLLWRVTSRARSSVRIFPLQVLMIEAKRERSRWVYGEVDSTYTIGMLFSEIKRI